VNAFESTWPVIAWLLLVVVAAVVIARGLR
jgi:hypothetical protein